jgi:hypothetical protein
VTINDVQFTDVSQNTQFNQSSHSLGEEQKTGGGAQRQEESKNVRHHTNSAYELKDTSNIDFLHMPNLGLLKYSSLINKDQFESVVLAKHLHKQAEAICEVFVFIYCFSATTPKTMTNWLYNLEFVFAQLFVQISAFHEQALVRSEINLFIVIGSRKIERFLTPENR